MGKVIGVGGVFLGFKGDDQALRDWYELHLGMDMSPYGTSFISGDQLTLVSFTRSNKAELPMINFRVDNIIEVHDHLVTVGCEITQKMEEYPYGTFMQFKDPFGNYIELWDPNIDEYRRMVEQEMIDYKQKKSTK